MYHMEITSYITSFYVVKYLFNVYIKCCFSQTVEYPREKSRILHSYSLLKCSYHIHNSTDLNLDVYSRKIKHNQDFVNFTKKRSNDNQLYLIQLLLIIINNCVFRSFIVHLVLSIFTTVTIFYVIKVYFNNNSSNSSIKYVQYCPDIA